MQAHQLYRIADSLESILIALVFIGGMMAANLVLNVLNVAYLRRACALGDACDPSDYDFAPPVVSESIPFAEPVDQYDSLDDPDFWKHGRPNPYA